MKRGAGKGVRKPTPSTPRLQSARMQGEHGKQKAAYCLQAASTLILSVKALTDHMHGCHIDASTRAQNG